MSRRGLAFRPAFWLCLFLCACGREPLKPVSFEELPSWAEDRVVEALPALRNSCAVLKEQEKWKKPCAALEKADAADEAGFRAILQKHFEPYEIRAREDGLYTGYYEASLKGSLRHHGVYQTPLWARPRDLIAADLGAFDRALAGRQIAGKVQDKKFVPYDTRAEIETNGLKRRAKILLWLEDPVDAFFLAVQGSGRVTLPGGATLAVSFDGKNGRPYASIGAVLLARGALARPVTADAIKAWLRAHPDQARDVMNANESFVFFRLKEDKGAVGAQGVPLTPGRSLAVDPSFVPLGSPLWLATEKRQKLVVAQDTGSAIKGPLRGDLFWGAGPKAEKEAGAMQERGRFYILKPREAK